MDEFDLLAAAQAVARRRYRNCAELRRIVGMSEEDFVQSIAARMLGKKLQKWLVTFLEQAAEEEIRHLTRKKRMPRSIRSLTERDEAELGAGGRWDAADSLAAREALLRMLDPGSGKRLGWGESRAAQSLLPGVP